MPLPCEGLAVIGAGCGRTGTQSLAAALEMLGFPCTNGFVILADGEGKGCLASKWHRALEGREPPDWDELFAGFRATVDFPAAVAYKELMEYYPDAKIILSVRDPHAWARSVLETIWLPISLELSWACAPWYPHFRRMGFAYRARFFRDTDGGIASGAIGDPRRLAQRFVEWNEEVKTTVPSSRLLVFEAADGWAPLCKFLGVPVPDVPYPHVNDTEHLKRIIRHKWRRLVALDAAIVVGAVVLGSAALLQVLRSRKM
jgi:hypothetical protein